MDTSKGTHKIAIADVKKDFLNVFDIDEKLKAIILYDGVEYKVISDLCPHMGADLSEAKLCNKSKILQCRWHGYKYGTSDLSLHENPNEKVWQKAFLSPVDQEKYKTPKYKLKQIPFKVENEFIHLLTTCESFYREIKNCNYFYILSLLVFLLCSNLSD